MSDEFENALDEQLDLAGEGLRAPDELDLAQDLEDRKAGESPTDTAAAKEETEDLTEEQFVYTTEGGEEIKGTVTEIAAALAAKEVEAKVAEEVAKVKAAATEKPAEAKPDEGGELPYEIRPIDLSKTGTIFQTMLEGGDPEQGIGGPETVGPQLQEFQFQTYAQDPRFLDLNIRLINAVLDQREKGAQKETAFKEFVGQEPDKAEVEAFMKANPHLESRKEAILGMQLAAMKQKIADLKTGKTKEVKEAETTGKKAGEKETIKSLKAKGQLRRVAGTGKPGGTRTQDTGKPPQNENERVSSWAKAIETRRQGAAT